MNREEEIKDLRIFDCCAKPAISLAILCDVDPTYIATKPIQAMLVKRASPTGKGIN